MTNRLALWLGALIIAFFVLDHFVFGWGAGLFLGRRFLDLIDWVAVWR